MSTEKDREAAIKHAQDRCPGQNEMDIVFSMCADDFMQGIQHARQGERERLERLFWFARSFEVHALRGKTSDLIDEFLEQEAKQDE